MLTYHLVKIYIFVNNGRGLEHIEMGKILQFSINIDSPQPVFYPGHRITGYVNLEIETPMEIKSIFIKLAGKGFCHWTENRRGKIVGGRSKRKLVDYTGSETHIKRTQRLFHALDWCTSATYNLPLGTHTYPFSLYLKGDLPSSFEGTHGYIRYLLTAIISKQGCDDVITYPITVNNLIDANHRRYADGVGGETQKRKCFCPKADHLHMNVNIDRSCYCPGETILINADIQNKTTSDMDSFYMKLIQTVTYHAQRQDKEENKKKLKTKVQTKEIAKLSGSSIPKGECVCWKNQAFGIPATQPTITNSKVMTVQYKLKLMAAMPAGVDPAIKMYITIGTIPHLATYGQSVQYGTPEDPQGPPNANADDDISDATVPVDLIGYPDMDPPSYSAGVGEEKINIGKYMVVYEYLESYCDKQYIPVYTFVKPNKKSTEWSNLPPSNNHKYIPVKPAPEATSSTID